MSRPLHTMPVLTSPREELLERNLGKHWEGSFVKKKQKQTKKIKDP